MLKNLPDWLKKLAFLLQAGLIGLGIAFLWILISGKNIQNQAVTSSNLSFAQAVERAQPAVVSIQTSTLVGQRAPTTPWGSRRSVRQKGLGSGTHS